MKKIGIYVHIPFCKQKCAYCDFTSFAAKEDLVSKYIDALKEEITKSKENKEEYEIQTIYFGGGTPSYIDSKYIVSVLNLIKDKFNINENTEITIEVNPGTVTKKKLLDYINSGINRISIGLQTTNDELLKIIGRIHNYSNFLETYSFAKEVGFSNINVDLMIGLPVQTIIDVEQDLERIIDLNPNHISVYSLIVEEGTKIEERIKRKELYLPKEELERKMYWNVKEILEKNGYKHYEISNFAKQGFESKHNLSCWNQEEYIGLGLGAHSYLNDKRYSNTEDFDKYFESPDNCKTIHEIQNSESKMKEYMILGLRKIDGVLISDFKNKFIENPIYKFKNELNKLVSNDLIQIDANDIKLTNKGIDLANLVWEEFI